MKTKLINLSVGDRFKYNRQSPEFEIFSFGNNDDPYDFVRSGFVKVRDIETGLISQHPSYLTVYIPPYQFYIQLSLF